MVAGAFERHARLSTPPTPSLRLAKLADAPWIARWSRELIETDLPWSWTPVRVARLLSRGDTNGYVAVRDGATIGFAIAQCAGEHAHMVLLAVHPGCRREGIGLQLIRWHVDALQVAGAMRLSLEVRARNREARLFYQQSGFRYVRSLPRYYCRREDAVQMTLAPIRMPRARPSATPDDSDRHV